MGAHILEIVVMLLVAAILGFLIAWFLKKDKSSENELNSLKQETEKLKSQIKEKDALLADCEQKLKLSESAEEVPESDEEAALQRIKEKAKEINFDRIGFATEAEKDDLKIISGIGPFIEKKLNALGIYTFRQIANFTEEDREKVNDAIEFFPGRIMRDDWIGQAKKLINKEE